VYVFYVFVTLAGALGTSLVWLLANTVFDARDARRLFPIVAAGGILGAVFGGSLTRLTAKAIGSFNLLFIGIGLVLLAALFLRRVRLPEAPRPAAQGRPAAGKGGSALRAPLVRHLVALSALVAVLSVVTDIQFNDLVGRSLPSRDAKTAFFFVTLPEALPIAVITRFIGWFHEFGIPVGGVIVNMVLDRDALGADVPEFVQNRLRMQQDHLETIREKFDGSVRAVVPLFDQEVRGVRMLGEAAAAIFKA